MSKRIFFGKDAREKVQAGVDKVSNAVKATLGYSGRHVIISNPRSVSYATKDGVTVAGEIMLEDPIENAGALFIKSVARKMLSEVGDGTTTATVLAQEIITEGLKAVNNGVNPVELKKGIDKAVVEVVRFLKEKAIIVESDEIIKNVATVSANDDQELGKLIGETYAKIGKDGIIEIEDSGGIDTKIETVAGMRIDSPMLNPIFINNRAKMQCEVSDVMVIIYNSIINVGADMAAVLEYPAKNGKGVLIIAEDITDEAMQLLAENAHRGFPFCAIKVPAYGDLREEILGDVAAVTKGVVYSKQKGNKLSKMPKEHMGTAAKIIARRDYTVIVSGGGDETVINNRIEEIRERLKEETDIQEKRKQDKRLAAIKGGVAVIKVGGVSDVEIRERKDRADDAIRATKAAMEEGVLPGAGTSYIRAIPVVNELKGDSPGQQVGIDIIKKILESPLRNIAINAGKEDSRIVAEVFESEDNFGYDGRIEAVTDLLKAGIVDPVKVCRFAIENAASVAGIVITSEVLMVEIEDKNPQK